MSVIEYQSGITTPTPDSRPLYIVHLSCFDEWLDSLSEAGQNWVRETAMPAKAGSCIILPDKHGQLSAAALLIDKNIIWEGAGAASKLPAASWAPEMTFAAEADLGDIILRRTSRKRPPHQKPRWRYQKNSRTKLLKRK